ncbi:hypothetical protein [Treponema sp.]|uniref:hypothetical protein n=1 Tax=Treponema sp. TaxID=166 RepID=UPI0025ED3DF5|nr:hypothetical protein [Treponema sp.]MCR5217325.1 hypothetical protein [Treponema sp.]
MKVKKLFISSFAFFSYLLISCSTPESQFDKDKQTLRSLAGTMDSNIEWTENLETKGSEKPEAPENLASNVKTSVQSVVVSIEDGQPVYPYIEGFASLYLGNADKNCVEKVRNFADSLIKGEYLSSSMMKDREYELTVFSYNFKNAAAGQEAETYLLGNPFTGDEEVQFPVRVYFKSDISNYEVKPHVDFFVYLQNDAGSWKIVSFDFF